MSGAELLLLLFAMTMLAGLAVAVYQRMKVEAAQKRDGHTPAEATHSFADDSAERVGVAAPDAPATGTAAR